MIEEVDVVELVRKLRKRRIKMEILKETRNFWIFK